MFMSSPITIGKARQKKTLLMGSVSAAVIVAGLAGSNTFGIKPAMAADADIAIDGGEYDAQAVGSTALSSDAVNTADIQAKLSDNTFVLTTGNTSTQPSNPLPESINSSVSVKDNAFTATAIGNEINSSSDLLVDDQTDTGVGVASVMLNKPTARVGSEISSNQVGYGLGTVIGDVLDDDVSTSTNRLTAQTTLNDARTLVDDTTGGLANAVAESDTSGSISFDASSSSPVSATGSVAVANSQLNLDPSGVSDRDGLAGSSAVVSENNLGFAIDVNNPNSVNASGQYTVDDNRLAAEFRGNDYLLPAEDAVSQNDSDRPGVGVVASSATSFEGSIAVANQQINNYLTDPVDSDGDDVPAVATLQNNNIIGDFTVGVETSILDGAVSVSENAMRADAIGNRGLAFIEFNANTNLVGADGGDDPAASTTVATGLEFGAPAETSADLALANQQVNAPFATSSASVDNNIGVIFDDIAAGADGDGSAIAVDQNQISAASSGNVGTNEILAGVTGESNQIDATAALSSSQVNARRSQAAEGVENSVDTTARVENATIGIRSTDFNATKLDSNNLDVLANAITAEATGNDATGNTINMSAATSLTTGDSSASVDGGFNLTSDPAVIDPSASGGTVLSNTQGLINSLTDASVSNATIGATILAEGDATGTNIMVGGDNLNGSVDAEGNATFTTSELARIAASATGQTAVNSLSLSSGGGSLTGSAALNSNQIQGGQDVDSFIGTRAEVSGSTIGAELVLADASGENDFTQSSMSVTRSEVSATARGSAVSNDVTVTAANTLVYEPTVGSLSGNSAVDLEGNGDSQVTPEITATGAAILANTQISNASTLANVDDIKVGTMLDGDVDNSSIMVDFNRVRADAIGNLVVSQSPGNSLTIDAQTLQIGDDVRGTIGTIANVQDLTGRPGPDASTDVQASVDDVFFDNDVKGDASNSTLNASSNTLTAVARGNYTMENFLNVTGGDISYAGGAQGSSMLLGLEGAGTQPMSPMAVDIDSSAAFVIANVQRGSVGDVSATVGAVEGVGADVTVEGSLTGSNNDIVSSSVDVSSNRFEALAFDNTGANTIQFGETEADGGAPVTTLATTSAIVSQQIAAGDTTATLGQPGTPGSAGGPFTAPSTFGVLTGSSSGSDFVATAAEYQIDKEDLTTDELNYLLNSGGFSDKGTYIETTDLEDIANYVGPSVGSYDSGTGNLTLFNVGSVGGTFTAGGTLPPTNPTFATPTILANIGGDITNISVDVSSNVNTAVARANSVINTSKAMANTLLGDTDGVTPGVRVDDGTTAGEVDIDTSADNQVSSLQTRDPDAEVTATAFAGVGISTSLEEGTDSVTILGSDLTVDNNVLSATAEGNVATNLVAADATTIGTDDGTTAGSTMTNALSNVQLSLAGGSATAGQVANDPDAFVADLFAPMAVENSSVSISDNTTQATTTLNAAENTVDVSGVNVLSLDDSDPGQALFNLDVATTGGGFSFGDAVSIAQATLSNVQIASESDPSDIASASAVMNIGNTDALVADTNGLTSSSIEVDGNQAQASVTGNTATNAVSQNGDSTLDAASVLASIQYGDIAIDADSRLDARLDLSSASSLPPHSNASVSMSDNINVASGTSNVAQNRVAASGTNIDGPVSPAGSGIAFMGELTDNSSVLGGLDEYDIGAVGSSVASNLQFSDADVTADAVTNILHQDTAIDSGIASTAMVQDGNLTIAEATGNLSGPNTRRTADERAARIFGDTIGIEGVNVSGAAVALSYQEGNGDISADATVDIVNNMLGNGLGASSASLSGNQTAAYATQNDATMSVGVDGTSIAGIESDNFAGFGSGSTQVDGQTVSVNGLASVGDNLVMGQQRSIGETVSSDVDMTVEAHRDIPASVTPSGGVIVNSSLSLVDNIAESNAAGNRASYSLSLNASSALTATGAVSNAQFNSAGVTATATMESLITNGTSQLDDLASSSALIGDNTVVARARGSVGTNILNVAAGSGINTGTGITNATAGTATGGSNSVSTSTVNVTQGTLAHADYAVMNAQENTGPINARVTDSRGEILNTGGAGYSSVRVSGNVMSADAVANSATNRITTTAMNNGGTTYGLANSQVNSGNVSSRVSNGSFGVSSGSMMNSSSSISGNSITARAVGNSAVNRIGRN